MKKLTYLLLLSIFSSCQENYPDLKGHWHIVKSSEIQMIADVLSEYEKIGRTRFIIIARENSVYPELKLWCKKINLKDISKADLKNQLTVETWLKQF